MRAERAGGAVELAEELGRLDPAELPGSMITQQVTNGVAVRMAVLYDLLAGGGRDLTTTEETA